MLRYPGRKNTFLGRLQDFGLIMTPVEAKTRQKPTIPKGFSP
jgi:hypothetical protein